ncbi:aspartic peptidase domain-containing protein [Russula vinacea]|nr:aspartic peptidase domain-containing protein [Russula vinacea]
MFTIISVVPSYMFSSLFLLLLPLLRTSALRRPPPVPVGRYHISGLENNGNLQYTVNIILGGQPIQVLIDTGSSDLWVSTPIAAAIDTGIQSGINYDIGEVTGEVKTAQLEFLGYTIPDQAFIEITPTSNTPALGANGVGLMGLGPNSGSRIYASLNNQPQGESVLDRTFQRYRNLNHLSWHFLTVLLGRLESIINQPQVPVPILPTFESEDQHWQVLLDEDGIIGPDGQPILVTTGVQSTTNPNQLTAVFDTGFSFPQVPSEVSDAIYSGIPGASLQNVDGFGVTWVIPCDAEIDIAFKIGGQTYPVHPLDTNAVIRTNSNGQICVGAFQPISSGKSSTYDLILGMAFLRNAYLLVNYGVYRDDPYIQLLSVTDPTAAHADFVNVRLNGTEKPAPTQVNDALHNEPRPTVDLSQPTSSHANGSFMKEKIPIIIVLSIGGALILIGLIVAYCLRDRFAKRRRGGLANTDQSYQRLSVPAPAGDMHQVEGYHGDGS